MLELEHGFRVLDVNARLPASEGPTSPEQLERALERAGIVRAAVAPGPTPPGDGYLRANNAVARRSVDRPFLPVARLNGPLTPGAPLPGVRDRLADRGDHHITPDDVERFAHDERFHAFLLAPEHDGLPDEATLNAVAAAGLPTLVRCGRSFPPAAAVAELLDRGVPTVLLGFGTPPIDRKRATAAVDLCADHDRLWLEPGRLPYPRPVERALREQPDRVVFGSHAPTPHPNVGVMRLLTLDVPADAMRRAFTHNPARALPALDD